MELPIYYIDTLQYKNNLSEKDKIYIAFHSLAAYLGLSRYLLSRTNSDQMNSELYHLIDIYKDQLVDIFLALKSEENLSMCQAMSSFIDISEINMMKK